MKKSVLKNAEFGKRLKKLRLDNHLTQRQLGDVLSELQESRKVPISVAAISHWETGMQEPSFNTVLVLAKYFGVSVDYLLGSVSEPTATLPKQVIGNKKTPIRDDDKKQSVEIQEIAFTELDNFDKRPLYVVFTNYVHDNQWGLYDSKSSCIIFTDSKIIINDQIKSGCKIYATVPDYIICLQNELNRPIGMERLLNMDLVYVVMKTPDVSLRKVMNGFYKHSVNKTHLVNVENGEILSYYKIGQNYNAYVRNIYDY